MIKLLAQIQRAASLVPAVLDTQEMDLTAQEFQILTAVQIVMISNITTRHCVKVYALSQTHHN